MKRIIKFWGNYSDRCEFSNCSTKYEVLPIVLDDASGNRELLELCLSNNWAVVQTETVKPEPAYRRGIRLTHAVQLQEKRLQNTGVYIKGREEKRTVYLGLVTIPECSAVPINEGTNKAVTKDQAYDLVNNQECDIAYTCDIEGEHTMVKQGWDYFHALPLLGYSLQKFEKTLGVTVGTFADEVTSCSECGEDFYESDGMNYKYRIVEECILLGLDCGCFAEYSKKNIDAYVNNPEKCIELEQAEELENEGRIRFVERFIGGMTDGRGGNYAGESVREGEPKQILKELLTKSPQAKYVFTHDESGQFQTYFSVWQVVGGK